VYQCDKFSECDDWSLHSRKNLTLSSMVLSRIRVLGLD
jgi:hypothetical protein